MGLKQCFNCHTEVDSKDSFCSNCGQKVDDNNLSLGAVFHEFIENYLSFDTRLGRTLIPFLFKPGKLVADFICGKRVSFVNPFRFYLIISIFFFFVLGLLVDQSVSESKIATGKEIEQKESKKEPSEFVTQLKDFATVIDSLEKSDSLLVRNKMDSLLKVYQLDSTVTFTTDSIAEDRDFVEINSSGSGFNIDITSLKKLKRYRYDKNYSNEDFLDSLGADSLNPNERYLALQTIRMYRSDAKVITRFILGNLSISMIVLIPGLAFFFFLFYYKKKMPYVAHLIHSLHIHIYSLFIFGLGILALYFFDYNVFIWLAFFVSAIYLFISLKKVYPNSVFSTFWRFLVIGLLYYVYWLFVIVGGIIISFLLF